MSKDFLLYVALFGLVLGSTIRLAEAGSRLPPPAVDSACEIGPAILPGADWDTLSDEGVDEIIRVNDALCAACPEHLDCPKDEGNP